MAASQALQGGDGVLTFTAGGESLCLPAADIVEVARVPSCTRVPNGPASLRGLANLRGRVTPVLSLATLLGHTAQAPTGTARLLVLAGTSPVGLIVDSVARLGAASDARLLDARALLGRDFAPHQRAPAAPLPLVPEQLRAAEPDLLSLVCFTLGSQEYALELACVAEILRVPHSIAAVPGTGDAMLGAMAFQGGLLPLACLATLLGQPAKRAKSGRVVVTDTGTTLVGLVVDGVTGAIAAPRSAIDPVPPLLARGKQDARLDGICRLDDGKRLICLLSPQNLFDADTTARLLAAPLVRPPPARPGSTDEQVVLFRLGAERYGVPVAAVDEVMAYPASVTRVPNAPGFVDGMFSLRGHAVPVIDMARHFGLRRDGKASRIIVVSTRGLRAALAVDAVSNVLRLPAGELQPAPAIASRAAAFDRIALRHEGRLVPLISPQGVLDAIGQILSPAGHAWPGPAAST